MHKKLLKLFQLGNSYLKIYDGGSDKDELLRSVTGNYAPLPLTSMRNQVYVMYTTNGNEVGKGFTAKIKFGKIIII